MSLSVAVKVDEKTTSGESDEVTNMSVSEGESPLPGKKISEQKTVIYQYSRDELMGIKGHPLSKIRPECLDPAFINSRGVWDPERWHQDCKRSETPPEDERNRGDLPLDHKRRSGDPRERLRKEQDGIVLSPQRRSFNTGCAVTVQPSRRPDSPLGKNDRDMGHREIPTRRIGSGRIPTRDMWDFRETDSSTDFFLRPPGGRDREDRRSFGRDFDRLSERPKDRHRGNRDERSNYDRRRVHSDSHEEEPEWFSGGPTSQHDTIELRGFEDIPEERIGSRESNRRQNAQKAKNARSSATNKKSNDSAQLNSSSSTNSSTSAHHGPGGRSTPTPSSASLPMPILPSPIREEDGKPTKDSLSTKSPPSANENMSWPQKESKSDQSEFNLEDFLKGDSIPGLLTNGAAVEGPVGSKFSQWFRRESPVHHGGESRRSSLQDELLSNIIGDIVIPISESNTYFAPISPAANTAGAGDSGGSGIVGGGGSGSGGGGSSSDAVREGLRDNSVGKPMQLLDLLHRRGQGDTGSIPVMKGHSIRDLESSGKVLSVEELEAKMRQGVSTNSNLPSHHRKNDEDLSAFNKLLAQVSDGKAIPASTTNGPLPAKPQPMNFLQQMLSKSQQQDVVGMPAVPRAVTGVRPPGEISMPPMNPLSGFGALGQQGGLGTSVPPGLGQAQHSPHPHPQQQHMQIPHDLVMKLLDVQQQLQHQQQQQQQQQRQQQQQQQQQQEMLNKFLAAGQQSVPATRLGPMGPQFNVPPPPSLSPLPPELQVMVANAQPSGELLQRPEAKALLQGLRYGEITPQHLVQQLQNPAMQHRHREVLVSILKIQMQQGTSPRTVSPHPHAQQPDMLHQFMLQQQQHQHQQQQLRIPSPLNSAYCQPPPVISPNLASNPNTLTVQHTGLPHRVPSPRELIAHTQNIMQSALIKKKLEEQRENFRKRQELQHSLSPNVSSGGTSGGSNSNASNTANNSATNGGNSGSGGKGEASSPAKHMSSPTPLAFTPTSVLRKMTAEKEPEGTNINVDVGSHKNSTETCSVEIVDLLQVLSCCVGTDETSGEPNKTHQQMHQQSHHQQQLNHLQQQQLRQQSGHTSRSQQSSSIPWNMPKQLQHQQGRAIVKGNMFQYGSNTDYQQQQQQHHPQQQAHQTRHSSLMGAGNASYSNNIARSKMNLTTPTPNMAGVSQQFTSLMMMHRPPMNQASNTRAQNIQAQLASLQQQQQRQQQQSQQQNLAPSLQQLLMSQNFSAGGRSVGKTDGRLPRGSQSMAVRQGHNSSANKDLSTSPTTNQLARWFSRAGQMTDMPPIPSAQNILSLEELERHQQSSATVHN